MRSRITFGAHTANMSIDGLPSERHVGYYRERARGGAGMIVVEPVPVHRTAVLTRGNFRADDDAVIEPFRRLVDVCRAETDADGLAPVMMLQLYHVGQHGDADNSFEPNWSPSGLPSYHDADGSHAMSGDEIVEIIGSFVRAATRAQAAGFDGVEVFAAYHALVDQFWTPWSNRRTDEWGGSFENRMRLSAAILGGIREACGDDFVVGLAVNVDPDVGASLSLAEMCEIVAWHDERRLMDYVTCGTGSYFDFYKLMPTSLYPADLGVPYAAALKAVTTHALVQAESHVRTYDGANSVLAAGHADLVSIVRGQIADPQLVDKGRSGRAAEVRQCISCNQLCWGRRSRDYFISCLVNPSAGREFEWGGDVWPRTTDPKSIVVVGGGPAGLETARVAAERGHRVRLVEASSVLGGQFRLAGLQQTRHQIVELIEWYERELDRLGVEVEFGRAATAAWVSGLGADEVVIATGAAPARAGFQRAVPMVDRLDGIDAGGVLAVHDVLEPGAPVLRGRVLLMDDVGDWRGIGTAMHLQEAGAAVTVVTSAAVVGGGLFHSAADVPARKRFASAGGEMRPFTVVDAWLGDRARLRSALTGAIEEVAFDHLVIAETAVPRSSLSLELTGAGIAHHAIGDCVAARRASLAIYEGKSLALRL